MSNRKNFFQELFIILASIVGIGFASGKEILTFFCYNKSLSLFSVLIFVCLFFVFFIALIKYKLKNDIHNFKTFNEKIYGQYSGFVNIILLIVYSFCASAMLSGADYLLKSFFNFRLPLFSLFLSVITFFIVKKGTIKIKKLFLKFVPIFLILMFINLFVNSYNYTAGLKDFSFFLNHNYTIKDFLFSMFLPAIFFGSNFVLALISVMELKQDLKKLNVISCIIFLIFLTLSVIVVINQNNSIMPFIVASKNISKVFLYLYFFAVSLALFCSLIISTNNLNIIINKKTSYTLLIIIFINQIISFLGFDFIVKYLYSFSGLLGFIYCLISFIIIIKLNKKTKNKK